METSKELKSVYEMLLSVPGMNEQVKVDLKISRRSILLLAQIMQGALSKSGTPATNMLAFASEEILQELSGIMESWLIKADLSALNEKLNALAQ